MKKLKILCGVLSVVLVVLIIVLVMLIMNYNSTDVAVTGDYKKGSYKEYSLDDKYMKLLGRSALYDGRLCFSHSGSGVEFVCKGAYAEVTLCAENPYVYSNHKPRVAIYVDDNLIVDECLSSEEKTFRIDTSYKGSVIKIIKLSEAMYSTFCITKVASYGMEDIAPAEEKQLKIEFIGDSITCGYGIDGSRYGTFSTATENFSKTYAYLTAQNLNADFSTVCFSGYGVFTGFTDGSYKTDKVIMNEYDKACILTGEDIYWDFSKADNDLIVINLGTNDASYCSGSYERRQMFVQEYIRMLVSLRDKNPDSYILCILGDMNNSLYSSIESAVSLYSESYDDSRVESYSIEYRMNENDIVVDGHPGEKSNRCASETLTAKINSLISLGYIR